VSSGGFDAGFDAGFDMGSDIVEIRTDQSLLQKIVRMQEEDSGLGDGILVDVAGLRRGVLEVDMATVPATGVVSFKGTLNGVLWQSLRALDLGSASESWVAGVTDASGLFQLDLSGLLKVKAEITGYSSGTITVWGHFWG